MGKLSLGSDPAQAAGAVILPGDTTHEALEKPTTSTIPVLEHAWESSGGGKIDTDQAIVLQNIALDFKKPNILDVKLGARLWDEDSPQEKRDRLDKVAAETTSKPLGFRIAGMKTWQGAHAVQSDEITVDGYKVFDKNYGRTFNEQTIPQGFRDYFLLKNEVTPSPPIKKVLKRFIRDLKAFVEVMEKKESRMYSASLLFVYEGDSIALDDAFAKEADMIAAQSQGQRSSAEVDLASELNHEGGDEDQPKFPAIWNVRLIDFAHAKWTPGQGPDENLLHGVRNVISLLQDLIG